MSDWRAFAACREWDPDLFFPVGNTGPALLQIEEAKAVCYRCQSIDHCLQWALETGQSDGVWGGLSEDERRAMKRRAVRRPKPKQEPLVFDRVGTPTEMCRDLYSRYTESRDGGHRVWTAQKLQVHLEGRDRTDLLDDADVIFRPRGGKSRCTNGH